MTKPLMERGQTMGEQMDQIFLDDLRGADEITIEGLSQRSWFQRSAERRQI